MRALHFADETWFVLTPLGVMLATDLHGTSAAVGDEQGTQGDFAPTPLTRSGVAIPNWDFQRRELRIGRIVVKRFSVPAENQETILTAFEEESWPVHIYDPLPPAAEIDPKRRLNSAIQCLNRNQNPPLLRFRGDGYGRGVRWELQLNRASA